ncbi:hypothetical protein BGX34_004758 [Mortierella sp. NVP85]|nr:hypothetical protein BGX34_004758 [Mortierella sp. NVP85]
MEHRNPETHSPTGCAVRARQQTRQQYLRESGHILGAEAHDRGSTHRPGWNLQQSRQDLQQRLNQRVQNLKESSGRASASGTSTGSGSGQGGGGSSGGGGAKKGKKPANKSKTWGTGGQRLGGVPGSGSGSGGSSSAS